MSIAPWRECSRRPAATWAKTIRPLFNGAPAGKLEVFFTARAQGEARRVCQKKKNTASDTAIVRRRPPRRDATRRSRRPPRPAGRLRQVSSAPIAVRRDGHRHEGGSAVRTSGGEREPCRRTRRRPRANQVGHERHAEDQQDRSSTKRYRSANSLRVLLNVRGTAFDRPSEPCPTRDADETPPPAARACTARPCHAKRQQRPPPAPPPRSARRPVCGTMIAMNVADHREVESRAIANPENAAPKTRPTSVHTCQFQGTSRGPEPKK